MSLFRIIGWTATVIGVFLVVAGILSTQETGEKIIEGFTGHFSDKTMWYILGGLGLIIVGAAVGRIKRRR